MALNEKYSYKSWKRKSFTGKDPSEFNNSEVVAAGFSQNKPFTKVFPELIKNVVFRDCNLDNCIIPAGATVKGGTNKHFDVQADGEYWIVDSDKKPIEPLKPYRFDEVGLSKDPKDLVTAPDEETRMGMPITVWKEHAKSLAFADLSKDIDKLTQILKSEGKI